MPGTAGILGPNFLSAWHGVRFLLNGNPWQALMASGSFDIGTSLGWGWYQNYSPTAYLRRIATAAQYPYSVVGKLVDNLIRFPQE